ncbi:hypothetical protein [Aliiglaciecola litoralis]|uniref:Lipoprotein n=1 Tax=Aliiglaciecola litoralis TaxID=582857 RepID=A0ABP3WQ56_9ALTE
MYKVSHYLKTNNIKRVAIILALIIGVSACQQLFTFEIVRFADRSTYMVTEQTLRSVDRSFYGSFHYGEWRYKGAQAKFGEVNAFIQIPKQLDMDSSVQQQYIIQVLCPDQDNLELWYQLKHVNLQLHLYSHSKHSSVSATCYNPLKNQANRQA